MNIIAIGKPRCLSDTMYQRLLKTPIGQMSDVEYEYFLKIHRKCYNENTCHDFHLSEILSNKLTISSMTKNEARYFDNMIYECDSINPCKLPQFVDLLSKDSTKMSHEEYYQYTELKEKCGSYMETYFPTKEQKDKKTRKKVIISVLLGFGCVVLFASSFFLWQFRVK
jgi:hypothetical protein